MIKKVSVIFFIFVIIAAVMLVTDHGKEKDVAIDNEGTSQEEKPVEVVSFVSHVIEFAKMGQVVDAPFIVGKTKIEAVREAWGSPDKVSEITTGTYEDYLSQNVTIGHSSDLVFDIRSYSSTIQQIHLEDIETIEGEADEIRSYQDNQVDQTILIYEVSSDYQLKWILPKVTEEEPNPAVDHVAVVTEIKQEDTKITNMSLEEKIGQMIFAGIEGTNLSEETKRLISTEKVGGIILFKDNLKEVDQSKYLLNAIKAENERNQYPIFLGVDEEGGRVSRLPGLTKLPTNLEIGKKNDSTYSYAIGALLGKELNAFGFNLDFAPVLDVNSNPKNPVIGDRSFGNNADIVSKLGIQTMRGIQNQNVIPVVKHFPGHGDTSVDSHLELPVIQKSIDDLQRLELIPFKNAISDGADMVMVAHILLPKIDAKFPASMSHDIITGILREKLQFDGVVITDDMTMNAIISNYEIGQAAVESVKAGNDIVLIAHDYSNVKKAIDALLSAVKAGEISEDRINESVNRILLLKEKYKLTNEEVKEINIDQLNQAIQQIVK